MLTSTSADMVGYIDHIISKRRKANIETKLGITHSYVMGIKKENVFADSYL